MAQKSADEHYKNIDFERNIIAASGGGTLQERAPLWQFSHFGVETEGFKHCHLCHSRMKNWVAIRNTQNGVILVIGHDCYDKLVSFLATKKLESLNMAGRKSYISAIKKYCKQYINESFLSWFDGQSKIPEEIQEAIAFIKKFGYAPSLVIAEAIVSFYKAHRMFAVAELFGPLSHVRGLLRILFPQQEYHECTIVQYENVDQESLRALRVCDDEVGNAFFKAALPKTAPLVDQRFCWHSSEGIKQLVEWVARARKEQATVAEEAWRSAVIDLQRRVAENQPEYRLLAFRSGINPKRGTPQWEARSNGFKYVLDHESTYQESEGPILTRIRMELVPNKIYLVSKLKMVPCYGEPRYQWVNI